MNDAQGNLFTDTVLLPYANSAYRKVQRALGDTGAGGFLSDDTLLVVAAVATPDASLQTSLTNATSAIRKMRSRTRRRTRRLGPRLTPRGKVG